jgi:phage head maturation protease
LNNHGVTVRLNVDHNPPFVRGVTTAETLDLNV